MTCFKAGGIWLPRGASEGKWVLGKRVQISSTDKAFNHFIYSGW